MKSVSTALIIVLLFALPVLDAHCQTANTNTIKPINKIVTPVTEVPAVCPNPKKLRGLCMFVDSKEQDPNPQGRYVFKYQRKLLEAACAVPGRDSEEQIAEKVRAVWKANEDKLICNNIKFDISNGSIIKFAVNLKFDEFLIDMAHWGIPLNRVDQTDGHTLLDYTQVQIVRNKGLPQEPVLQGYYVMFRKAGAKHKSEL